jgi:hypothetical protein
MEETLRREGKGQRSQSKNNSPVYSLHYIYIYIYIGEKKTKGKGRIDI